MPEVATTACWGCGGGAAPAPDYPSTGYWRCSACGLLFAPARSSSETEAELYDATYFAEYPGGEDYEFDDEQRRFEALRRLPFVQRHRSSGRLLEIGAAAGHFVRVAADAGYEATGIEPAAPLAKRGAQRLGVDLRAGLLETAELAEGEFDVICAWHVLEHLPEPNHAMERIHALLTPGGVLCVEVPNVMSVTSRRDREAWFHLHPQHHVTQFSPGSLTALLQRKGLAVVATETVSALSYLRPARVLRPRGIAAVVKETAAVRASPWSTHEERHELLRAAARKSA
jgi:2-polyprenyl-3-methyl-5-hydroxy-6-metoxy-1,4-benzoquinol methylase